MEYLKSKIGFNKNNTVSNGITINTKKTINNYIDESLKMINNIQLMYLKTENNILLINSDNIKILKFYFLLLQKTTVSENVISLLKNKKNPPKIKNIPESTKKLLNKLLLISLTIENYINNPNYQKKNIYKLIKFLFINDIILKEDLLLTLKIIFFTNMYKEENNEINSSISELICFLLLFKSDKKLCNNFEYILYNIINFIEDNLKNKYDIIISLSNNKNLFKMLELSDISKKSEKAIFDFLIKFYKNYFNIDLLMNELSDQFTYNTKEKDAINKKLNKHINLMKFLSTLFQSENEYLISNECFYFNNINDGIKINNILSTKIPTKNFSIVISFNLFECKKNVKYTIFSLRKKKECCDLYIENNILKILSNGSTYDLFNNIQVNKNYILWIHHETDERKIILFYLNDNICDNKKIHKIKFPQKEYDIYLGFKKKKKTKIDNFHGLIGTFIIFNISLIENISFNNLIKLKGDYDKIIYANHNLSYSLINEDTKIFLEKYKNDLNHIEAYISPNIITKNFSIDTNSNKIQTIRIKKTFESFINVNGIKYLEMQLYWIIGIISDKENNFEYNNIILMIKYICDIFFDCISRMNKNQRLRNSNGIKLFFYTLNNLMDISFKFGYKMNSIFISSIINNINIIFSDDNFFSYFLFLFSLNNYDQETENESLSNLFSCISENIIEKKKIILSNEFFEKILDLDIIYLSNNYNKETKKAYSKLIKLCLVIILNKENYPFLNIYLNKLKEINLPKNLTLIQSIIRDSFGFTTDIAINLSNLSNLSNDEINNETNININIDKNDKLKNQMEEKESNLLLYKYLKNLYVSLDKTKNNSFDNFKKYCNQDKEIFIDYIKEIFEYLIKNYDMKLQNVNNNSSQDFIIPELLKSLCISFLLDIDDTMKNSNNDNNISINNITTKNTFDLSHQKNYSLISIEKESLENDINRENNEQNNIYLIFFNCVDISPFIFRSIFLNNFPDLSHPKKMKYIKDLACNDQLIFSSGKYLPESKEKTLNLIQLIEKIGLEGSDLIIMNRYKIMEYVNEIFINTTINLFKLISHLEDNLKNEYNIILPKINNLNYSDELILKFYTMVLNCIQKNITKLNHKIKKNEGNKQLINDNKVNLKLLEEFLNIIKKKLFYFIDLTIFKFEDPFYFKLLFEIYIKDDQSKTDFHDKDFVLTIIKYIIDKFDNYDNNQTTNLAFELNNKNLLILIYKMIFFKNKRKFLLSNDIFKKYIITYLITFWTKSKIFFYKTLFPLESINDTDNGKVYKKILVELLFEIYVDLYIEYNNEDLILSNMLEGMITELLNLAQQKTIIDRLNLDLDTLNDNLKNLGVSITNTEDNKKNTHSLFYLMDKIYIKKCMINEINNENKNDKSNNNKKLSNEINFIYDYISKIKTGNDFSVTILFLVKIMINIIVFEEKANNSSLLEFFKKRMNKLCKDSKELFEKNKEYNPLIFANKESNNIYKQFEEYILKKYAPKSNVENSLLSIIENNKEQEIKFKSIEYSIVYKNNEEKKKNKLKKSLKKKFLSSKRFIKNISKKDINTKSQKNEDKINNSYEIVPSFKKDYIRRYLSSYFIKLLTYDRNFMNVKRLYDIKYSKEIGKNNSTCGFEFPIKIKNKISNNYSKNFIIKDFNFIQSKYLQYSHKFLKKNKNFKESLSKYLFPSKLLLLTHDYANKNVYPIENTNKDCELITVNGSIYGNLLFYENCAIFKSNEKDERENNNLKYLCCSSEFDFLHKEKKIIIDFSKIKEILIRRYLFLFIAIEIFMKDGKSYFFNFFNEGENNFILDYFSKKGVKVIKNLKQYFNSEEYTKKWKLNEISTYDYLLLINKFSSRSYNEASQYLVMPWIFLLNESIRNFDLPMGIQNKEIFKEHIKSGKNFHSCHYSTSSYICYYLMRINPFTNYMIRLQSNSFDTPQRQFNSIYHTLDLCEKIINNRELLPELFIFPEIYMNLNCNDLGKLRENEKKIRIHNIDVSDYAKNNFEFVYKLQNMLNNNESINSQINKWIDFIFGVNQYNKNDIKGKGLRRFSEECYSQNVNIKKVMDEMIKKKMQDNEIIKEIKATIGIIINFGQCPHQIFNLEHPIKDTISITNNDNNNENNIKIFYNIDNDKNFICLNRKNENNNYLYFLINNNKIVLYQKDIKMNTYVLKNSIIFIFNYSKTLTKNIKFIFCDLTIDTFIFSNYLSDDINIIINNKKYTFLLPYPISCATKIKDNEFITGHEDGVIIHWNIDNSINLKIIKIIKSNQKRIIAIEYNQRNGFFAVADEDSVIIRDDYDFQFLNIIKEMDKEIIDIKISDFNFIYLLVKSKEDINELRGYTINGLFFGKYENKITDFKVTEHGNIVVCLKNENNIKVLNPVNFEIIYSKNRYEKENNEGKNNNIIMIQIEKSPSKYLICEIVEDGNTIIEKIKLNDEEFKYFI